MTIFCSKRVAFTRHAAFERTQQVAAHAPQGKLGPVKAPQLLAIRALEDDAFGRSIQGNNELVPAFRVLALRQQA
jgi:hypothetical protein